MKTRLRAATEHEIETAIVEGLRYLRYRVLRTSEHRRRCRTCGVVTAGGNGQDRGLGDVLFRRDAWPEGLWAMCEVKRPDGKWSSLEQREVVEAGGMEVVHSFEEAEAYAARMDEQALSLTGVTKNP